MGATLARVYRIGKQLDFGRSREWPGSRHRRVGEFLTCWVLKPTSNALLRCPMGSGLSRTRRDWSWRT